jgi:pimeloyl-ACP methyl ester carboxylesterase
MRLQQDIAARSSAQLFVVDGGHQLQLDNPEDCAEYIARFHLARVQAFESR